jgi:Serine aminopeptidase, S33
MQASTFTVATPDGVSLFVYRWLPNAPPKAVVQIVHGLAEHAARYARIAAALCSAGYAVYGRLILRSFQQPRQLRNNWQRSGGPRRASGNWRLCAGPDHSQNTRRRAPARSCRGRSRRRFLRRTTAAESGERSLQRFQKFRCIIDVPALGKAFG